MINHLAIIRNIHMNICTKIRMNMGINMSISRLIRPAAVVCLFQLSACASGPPPADWKTNARDSLESAQQFYLQGHDKLAQSEQARARSEVAASGRLDLLARVLLTHCAAQIASLAAKDCPEFTVLANDAQAGERNYAAYISGQWQNVTPALLPKQHQAIFSNPGEVKNLSAIKEPLAQLLAAALLLQREKITPEGIALAIETASDQGWRRPLLAWLGVQAQYAEKSGNSALAQLARRRMALVAPLPAK
jgi:hypothetical protein